jgi:hypothetical protein
MNRKVISGGAAMIIAFAVLGISSCKKDKDLQTKSYTMTTYGSSGISGVVEFKENDDNTTTVHVHMMNTASGVSYPAHIHMGPITAPGSIVYDLGPIPSSGGMAMKDTKVSVSFDDMINYNGCFVAHDPADISNYVLVGNIGSNAP